MLPEPKFYHLLEEPESDEVRNTYGRVEDQLDRAIGHLVDRNLKMVRVAIVEALKELNAVEVS